MAENNSSAPLKTAEGVDSRTPADMRVNGGALKLALNVLRRAGKNEVADELEKTAEPAVAAQAAPAAVVYAEARECSHCNHVGINDSADGVAACISCAWHGDSPKDDKCPECEAEGTMTASCPKCHHEYRLLADASIATPALPATEDFSAGDLADWRTPTSYLHRFREAITLVCRGKTPPDNMLTEWLAGDSEELQDFAGTHAPAWAQGIGAIEAATVMADQPTEGVEHEFRDESQPLAEVQAEPVASVKRFDFGGYDLDVFRTTLETLPPGEYRLYTAPQAQPADALDAEIAKLKKTCQELGNMFHDQIVAQQAAWIEWQHGQGAEAGMRWIENGLCGPGHIPEEGEPYGTEAQAYFDANKSDPFPACYCGRPSNILWMGKGFCSDAHHDEHRAAMAAAQEGGKASAGKDDAA